MTDKHRSRALDEHLGEMVEVTFFNGSKRTGVLQYEEKGFRAPFYRKGGFYYIENCGFRKSHVTNIRRA